MHLVEPKNQSISSSPTPKLSSNHLVKDSFEGESEGNDSNTQKNNDKITIDDFYHHHHLKEMKNIINQEDI